MYPMREELYELSWPTCWLYITEPSEQLYSKIAVMRIVSLARLIKIYTSF